MVVTERFGMTHMRAFAQALAIATLGASPTALAAQSASPTTANSTARLIHPVSVVKVSDLDFGGITVAAAGTVVLNPDTGAVTYSGGVVRAGGTPRNAEFLGASRKRTVVNIRVPKAPITLTRAGGSETLTVSNWTLQGQSKKELADQTTFTFQVGATLSVPASPVEGTYIGSFAVEVQYP